ncbi:MAG: cupin domain-containing protein [Ignavibacteria bacterium]|nr:cupin domain-containing protein [Ignavibacteria bacterium]
MSELNKNSEKINLFSTAQYQQGAVVSKVLLKKRSGNITLFAFDKGEGLSEHTAPFDAYVHVLDGEVEVIISGNQNILQAGDAIIMPAGEPHSLKAITAFKMVLVMIKSE